MTIDHKKKILGLNFYEMIGMFTIIGGLIFAFAIGLSIGVWIG